MCHVVGATGQANVVPDVIYKDYSMDCSCSSLLTARCICIRCDVRLVVFMPFSRYIGRVCSFFLISKASITLNLS